jgi:hypothetical protein
MISRLSDQGIAELVSNVTQTMMGMRFAVMDTVRAPAAWRAAVLAIGEGAVTIMLSSTQNGCAALGAALFSCAASQVDVEMVDDSLRELVNMTAGRIKAALMLDMALGLPHVVVDGAGLQSGPWRIVRLQAEGVDLYVWLSDSGEKKR